MLRRFLKFDGSCFVIFVIRRWVFVYSVVIKIVIKCFMLFVFVVLSCI